MLNRSHFDYLIFIGRFQPLHIGHVTTLKYGLQHAKKVIVICGSARQACSLRNPWSLEERKLFIESVLLPQERERVFIGGVSDRMYNDQQWVTEIQNLVDKVIAVDTISLKTDPAQFCIGIIGSALHSRSTYYLDLFPQWQKFEAPNIPGISATIIRDNFFHPAEDRFNNEAKLLPEPIYNLLLSFKKKPIYADLSNEYQYIKNYQRAWAHAPYPPIFVTVDAVVIHSGHILLIRRRHFPSKGLWALPGGFIKQNEQLKEAVIRELKEETRIKVPAAVLIGSLRNSHVFDLPQRSLRGRTITHAFLIELTPTKGGLPKIRGSEETDHVCWVPLSEFYRMEDQLFEDHFYIVSWFLGQI